MLDRALADVRALGVARCQQAGTSALVAAVTRALETCSDTARVLAGQRPLCAPHLLAADDVPTATRIAVALRDGGCRMIGCASPADWCDVHHLVHRADGGDHHPDDLALFCRKDHTIVHKHAWTLTLDPATGILTARRGTHEWRTQPHGTPLAPAPQRPTPRPPPPHHPRPAPHKTPGQSPHPRPGQGPHHRPGQARHHPTPPTPTCPSDNLPLDQPGPLGQPWLPRPALGPLTGKRAHPHRVRRFPMPAGGGCSTCRISSMPALRRPAA